MSDVLLFDANNEPVIEVEAVSLTPQDAALLREYKTLLERYGLREALYCNRCFDGSLEDGCKAFVTSGKILIECRCSVRTYVGV